MFQGVKKMLSNALDKVFNGVVCNSTKELDALLMKFKRQICADKIQTTNNRYDYYWDEKRMFEFEWNGETSVIVLSSIVDCKGGVSYLYWIK